MFAESCRTGQTSVLSAANANQAVACVYAALGFDRQERCRGEAVGRFRQGQDGNPRRTMTLPTRIWADLTQPEIKAQLGKQPLGHPSLRFG